VSSIHKTLRFWLKENSRDAQRAIWCTVAQQQQQQQYFIHVWAQQIPYSNRRQADLQTSELVDE
jgi:hypothetical protein